jgi:hypothetical protein
MANSCRISTKHVKVMSRVGVLHVTYKTGFGLDDWIYWHLIHTPRDTGN